MTVTVTPTVTTVAGSELLAALKSVLPFADNDRYAPEGIACVRLDASDGTLTVVATNRYVLGSARVPHTGSDLAVSVPINAVKSLVTVLAATLKAAPMPEAVGLEIVGSSLMVSSGNGPLVSVPTGDAEFPSWRSLIPSVDTYTGTEMVSLNPAYLALFAKVSVTAKGTPMVLRLPKGGTGAVRVDIGETFTGLIMTMRRTS